MSVSKVFILLFVGTAVGCILWFGLFKNVHYFGREVSQEARAAELVGAKPLPKEPVKIAIEAGQGVCTKIDRASIDGGDLWIYYHNDCRTKQAWIKFKWKYKSPDGTIVAGGERYSELGENGGPSELDANERAEFHQTINDDSRAAQLIVSVQSREP